MHTERLREILEHLAKPDRARDESIIQSEVREVLLEISSELGRDGVITEAQLGDGRRIDVQAGSVVIETKRDLARAKGATDQLEGYLRERQYQSGTKYSGILTDGRLWQSYHLADESLELVSEFELKSGAVDVQHFVFWLDGIATALDRIPAQPQEIRALLGAESSAHALAMAELRRVYEHSKGNPEIQMKRTLWARLLTTALGTQFRDDTDLFIRHTLLVNTAEVIAHAVMGIDPSELTGEELLNGSKFRLAGVRGVVEADFFDWVAIAEDGEAFLDSLKRRLIRFDWSVVSSDILKVLYESVISAETRKSLGEYYTPDWLAEKMVQEAISDPLNERVLDPACGSGTFLFQAVRHHLKSAAAAGLSADETLLSVTRCVIGMDLHPVSVALARVTYLLALGKELLSRRTENLHIPVFIGDSMRWNRGELLRWADSQLSIQTDDLLKSELKFPEALVADAQTFDAVVSAMSDRAHRRKRGTKKLPALKRLYAKHGVDESYHETLDRTFHLMCTLHDGGRDHIWGYYVRNLVRPIWLARKENAVDVLIGNPPWLAFRYMPEDMQHAFRAMCQDRGMWHGAKVATHQDLSGLFVARSVELYLRVGGKFSFVVPTAALDRDQFEGFRTGSWGNGEEGVRAEWQMPWDLKRLRPHFFPIGSAVVRGKRGEVATSMPAAQVWTGRVPKGHPSYAEVESVTKRAQARTIVAASDREVSPYRDSFRQGAILVPRVLLSVVPVEESGLGFGSRTPVRSARSNYEKKPWKNIADLKGAVESQFVRPLLLGEHLLPYRLREHGYCIIPEIDGLVMDGDSDRIEEFPGLGEWMQQAEGHWMLHRSSKKLTLRDQIDYRGKLSGQLPSPSLRLCYGASGMHAVAAMVEGTPIIDSSAYWAPLASKDEGHFLLTFLNAPSLTELVRPYMPYGKDERHLHKHIWNLPIPRFDVRSEQHQGLVGLAQRAEAEVLALPLDETKHFSWQRKKIRSYLATSQVGQDIDAAVRRMLVP